VLLLLPPPLLLLTLPALHHSSRCIPIERRSTKEHPTRYRLTNTKSAHFSILIFPLKLYTCRPVNPQSTFINFNYSRSPLHWSVEAIRLSEVLYPEEYLNSMTTYRAG
jgi:hypothetical protein